MSVPIARKSEVSERVSRNVRRSTMVSRVSRRTNGLVRSNSEVSFADPIFKAEQSAVFWDQNDDKSELASAELVPITVDVKDSKDFVAAVALENQQSIADSSTKFEAESLTSSEDMFDVFDDPDLHVKTAITEFTGCLRRSASVNFANVTDEDYEIADEKKEVIAPVRVIQRA